MQKMDMRLIVLSLALKAGVVNSKEKRERGVLDMVPREKVPIVLERSEFASMPLKKRKKALARLRGK